ncbi:MAG TPA: hypothetical protein VMM78_14520 [Thermomicrobiales bacterium]|nr:hypothetical protein [Thermomicrobiales bacterium]
MHVANRDLCLVRCIGPYGGHALFRRLGVDFAAREMMTEAVVALTVDEQEVLRQRRGTVSVEVIQPGYRAAGAEHAYGDEAVGRLRQPDDPYDDEYDGIFEDPFERQEAWAAAAFQREIDRHEQAKRERYAHEGEARRRRAEQWWEDRERKRDERPG